MSWFYPKERKLNARDIEAYAHACWDLIQEFTGDNHCKMYDPLTIEGNIAHSYIFNLKDGGRHHKFKDLEELRKLMLKETIEMIRNTYEEWADDE